MKKLYTYPAVEIFKLQPSQVLCSSPEGEFSVGVATDELEPNTIGD